ncbi:MAG: ABC transporter substrate-binding protein, partial [Candidatus Krumholzibacteriia bacterium]
PEKIAGVRVYRTPALSYQHVTFNCRHPILSDVRVRRALAWATHREDIVEAAFEGVAQPARAGMHPNRPGYNPLAEELAVHDVQRAEALLEEAGWSDSDGDGIRDRGGRPLRLEINTGAGMTQRERTQAILQQQWRRVGVDLVIQNHDFGVVIEKLVSGDFETALFGWGQSPDPAGIEVVYGTGFAPPNGQNMGRFSNARFDELAARGTRVADHRERIEIYREIQEILLRNVPAIPLVWAVELDPMTERLQNFHPNPTDAGDTWNVHEWRLSP